jgi:hypothetical protein
MSGRRWAYIGALLGGVVSVLANIAHSYVPPAGAGVGWQPPAGAVAGAVFWPVALFVAIEVLARVPWPAGRRWFLLRFGGLLPVALVAAVVSYRHLSGLLHWYGEDRLTVTIGPLAVDGLMIVATAALVATGRPRVVTPPAEPVPAVAAPMLPHAEVISAQVDADPVAVELPPAEPEAVAEALAPVKATRPRKVTAPRRPFATTQRAAAAMAADGMEPPAIAEALGITVRQVRTALKPVPVESSAR